MKIRLTLKSQTPANALAIQAPKIVLRHRSMRVLDFDIENRPLSYLGSDFTTAEVTAIAWAWCDKPDDVKVYLLGEHSLACILTSFADAYQQADLVTGHFITGHDLPMVNGALMECGMAPLPDRLVHDTKVHMMRSKGISLSQESLSAMFRLSHQKESMNQAQWRAANRLTPEGLAEVRRRATGDVQQHIELRQHLLDRGYLRAPQMWRCGTAQMAEYVP